MMKIEIELWMLYFFEARKDTEALMELYAMFLNVAHEYPLVEAFSIKAMYAGYMTTIINEA